MLLEKLKIIPCLMMGMIFYYTFNIKSRAELVREKDLSGTQPTIKKPGETSKNPGYRAIASYENQFIAVGSDGRIDRISESGQVNKLANSIDVGLNGVIYTNQSIIVVGDHGTILISTDSQNFNKVESGTTADINGITSFNGELIAVADQGTILISENQNIWKKVQLSVEGDIVSISSNSSQSYGSTNRGEIIHTSDGQNWDIFNYNKEYSGYSKACSFQKILATENKIAVIGHHDDGSPVLLFSSIGKVWAERFLNFTDNDGIMRVVTNQLNDICFDEAQDQYFIACDCGEILKIPSCTKCNQLSKITTKDLRCILLLETTLVILGDDFFVDIIEWK